MSDSYSSFVWGTDGRVPSDSDDSPSSTFQIISKGFDDASPLDNFTTDLRMHDGLFPGMAKDMDFGSLIMPTDSVRRLAEFQANGPGRPPLAQELSSLRTRARGDFVFYRPPGPVSDESQAHSSFIPAGHAVDMAPVAGLLTPSYYYEPHTITSSFDTETYGSSQPPYSQSTATHYGTLALDISTPPAGQSAWSEASRHCRDASNTMEPFGSVTHDSPDLTQPAPSPPRTPASSFTTVTDYSPLNTFQQGSAAKPYQNLRQFDLNEHVATHGGDSLPSSQSSGSGTVATGNDKRNTKRPIQTPIGAFRCQHEGCAYSASSNKDLKRHLQSRKHRNATDNATDESATTETYRCLAPGCKFAEEGCYRLDNLMRHIKTVHYRRGSPPVEDPEGKSVVVTYS